MAGSALQRVRIGNNSTVESQYRLWKLYPITEGVYFHSGPIGIEFYKALTNNMFYMKSEQFRTDLVVYVLNGSGVKNVRVW
jgi:hypothetical protein